MSSISSSKSNINFAKKEIVRSVQTASVLATSGWSDSGNGFSVTIPVTGVYKLSAEFNAYAAASSDGYWAIGINGVNHIDSVRRVVGGAGGTALSPTHIEVITNCNAGDVITLRNNEASGDVRADIGSGSDALGYIQAEMVFAYVPVIGDLAWTIYPLTIGAVTTAPTKGTIERDVASWRRVGANMEIMYTYRQSTTGTNGTGIYLFPIPSGYAIDTSLTGTVVAPSYNAEAHVGSGTCFNGSNSYPMTVHVYNTTNFTLMYDSSASVISNAAMGLGSAATIVISYKASVPIIGW